eukprot:359491-Chlamydomonas_euryale.AAC.12
MLKIARRPVNREGLGGEAGCCSQWLKRASETTGWLTQVTFECSRNRFLIMVCPPPPPATACLQSKALVACLCFPVAGCHSAGGGMQQTHRRGDASQATVQRFEVGLHTGILRGWLVLPAVELSSCSAGVGNLCGLRFGDRRPANFGHNGTTGPRFS